MLYDLDEIVAKYKPPLTLAIAMEKLVNIRILMAFYNNDKASKMRKYEQLKQAMFRSVTSSHNPPVVSQYH